jgi:hypothetical protein
VVAVEHHAYGAATGAGGCLGDGERLGEGDDDGPVCAIERVHGLDGKRHPHGAGIRSQLSDRLSHRHAGAYEVSVRRRAADEHKNTSTEHGCLVDGTSVVLGSLFPHMSLGSEEEAAPA